MQGRFLQVRSANCCEIARHVYICSTGSYNAALFPSQPSILAVDSTNLVSDLVQHQRHSVVEGCLRVAQEVACVCRELLVQMENALLIPVVGCTVQERLDYATRSARFGYANVRVCQQGRPLCLQATKV